MIKTKNIRQTITIHATPQEVYEAFMDSRKHSRFTGSPARISKKVGGTVAAFDGYITGTNVELIKDKKIVQSWTASGWPKGHASAITLVLTPVKTGTKITFTHRGVPGRSIKSITEGWKTYYWEPLKKLFKAR